MAFLSHLHIERLNFGSALLSQLPVLASAPSLDALLSNGMGSATDSYPPSQISL